MARNRRFATPGWMIALLVLIGTAPAAADWLVTHDGLRLETKGPWRVEDELVLFETPNGTLSSLRLTEVDLERSASATAAAKAGPPAPRSTPEPRVSVMRITDADVARARSAAPASARPGAESDAPTDEKRTARLVVTDWRHLDDDEGVAITGTLNNVSTEVGGSVRLTALFRDFDGKLLISQEASLSASTLRPGQKAEFRVSVPGLFTFADVEFEIDHFTLLTAASEGSVPGPTR